MAQLVLGLTLVIAITAALADSAVGGYSYFCSPPHAPAYGGYYHRSYYTLGSSVTYYCRLGYHLYGSPNSVCSYDRYRGYYWSHRPPVCRRKVVSCGLLAPPANGQVRFKGTTVGSRAQYSCNRGFSLAGKSIRVCLASGQWSGQAPRCVSPRCDKLRNIPNGRVQLTGTTVGSKATYSCNQGFVLVGSSTRVCQGNREWSGREPVCKAIKCDRLRDIENGRVDLTGTTVGSKATYSCNLGYTLVGKSTRVCQANGEWSGREPFCKLIKCDSLPNIKNGRVVLSGTTVGSTATYSCNKGYVLVGRNTRVCQSSGEWSGREPFCKLKQCDRLPNIANGQVELTGVTVGSIATYSCNKGFVLVGIEIRLCQANREWSGQEPVCKPIHCDRLPDIANGQVELSGTSVGSTATYSCNKGFVLVGGRTRVCQSSGQWSGKEPVCKRIKCDRLPDIANGRVVLSGTTIGSTATYSCNKNYVLVGGSTRKCQANGEWSGREPFCKLIKCDSLPDIKNGRVVLSGTTVGSTATYSCNKGYVLVGRSTRVCQSSGEWSGREPFCKLRECDDLPDIANGQVRLTGTTVGSTATYICNKGFILVGKSSRVCQPSGEWSGQEPVCKRLKCETLSDIENGRVQLTGTTVGSRATYSCNRGYVLVGLSSRVCQASGEWSGQEPFCKIVDCGDLPDPRFGKVELTGTTFGSTATYSCQQGYLLVGGDTRMCQASGQWSGSAPFCKIIDCGNLPNPKFGKVVLSGTVFHSTATYSCQKGFILVGRVTRTCQASGEWSGEAPICEPIECERLPDIENGRVILSDTIVGSTATYSCSSGYVLVGDRTRTCQSNGEWSGSEPFCKFVECETLSDIPNGRVRLTGTTVGSRASYSCNKGYILVGDATRVCQLSGEWSGREPLCRIVDCDSLSNPRFGSVDLTGTDFGSTATYSCQKGYVLSGKSTRTCQANGQWSGVAPVCRIVDCGTLPNPSFGRVVLSGTTLGSTATYICFKAHELVGRPTRTCQANGQWSGDAPTCEIVDCGRLDDPEFGHVAITTTTFGSVATYSCQRGYILVGQTTRVCTTSGQWSGSAPACKIVECDSLPNPKNGRVELSGTTVTSTATYSCNDGFVLEGGATRTCQANGQWTGSAPVCKAIVCGLLRNPRFGKVALSGTTVGSVATYSCFKGYALVGKDTRGCQADGQWSGTAPFCKLVDCGLTLEPPKDGFVHIPCTVLDCTAVFRCRSGYSLIGDKTSTCLPYGFWSGETPVCRRDYY